MLSEKNKIKEKPFGHIGWDLYLKIYKFSSVKKYNKTKKTYTHNWLVKKNVILQCGKNNKISVFKTRFFSLKENFLLKKLKKKHLQKHFTFEKKKKHEILINRDLSQ